LSATGERSGLQTHIATTVTASSRARMKSLTAFLELESMIQTCGE
jgi:hypothetical protein